MKISCSRRRRRHIHNKASSRPWRLTLKNWPSHVEGIIFLQQHANITSASCRQLHNGPFLQFCLMLHWWNLLRMQLFQVVKIWLMQWKVYSNVRGGGKLRSNFPTEREWVYNFANNEHFNTATHGGLKNIIFEIFFWQGATATCLQWVQKTPKNTFWGISPVSSVTISLNFFLVTPHVIANSF
jgi:hypothetical protein